MPNISLGFGFKFFDLYDDDSLQIIDNKFLSYLKDMDEPLFMALNQYRDEKSISRSQYSYLIDLLAVPVEKFLINLFKIPDNVQESLRLHTEFQEIYNFKRNFVQRKILNKYKIEDFLDFCITDIENELEKYLKSKISSEKEFVNTVSEWLLDSEKFSNEIQLAEQFIAWNCFNYGRRDWIIFKNPQKKDYSHLVDLKKETVSDIDVIKLNDLKLRNRDGFNLTDDGITLEEALDQANYCIYCHKQGRDSCSLGFKDKEDNTKDNPLGDPLKGCPLGEKISEMNQLKANGKLLSALAVAIIDNPMLAGTGHRICNECMKSCIYQKQDPVNIPKVETRVLRDVLELPLGFEIYSLLTRWNPFNIFTPYPKKDSGKKVLVVGMGPAGFTLSHYLLNQGHTVIGIDGLKIERLPNELSGNDFAPIKDINVLYKELEDRPSYGFGGVMEYGITVRWDKNFLTIIRMLLERRNRFKLFGGIRFGGNLDWRIAFDLGFDHIALAIGAGRPNILNIPNSVALGVRTASDFLMSLQLNDARDKNSISNLQIRLPIIVVGGGLTAIDTATEAKAYYVRQVEKLYKRYSELCEEYGKKFIEEYWLDIDREIAKEFFEHAQIFAAERKKAKHENRKPNFNSIIKELGGVRVLYRKPIELSPSYRLNHEELALALEEGIEFIENASPKVISKDENGYIKSLKVDIDNNIKELDVRSLLVAIGTNPNITLSKEDSDIFKVDRGYFKFIDPDNDNFSIFKNADGKGITVFGDLHPKYKGNVVKAMASAKDGYKVIDEQLSLLKKNEQPKFIESVSEYLSAKVERINELAEGIIEVVIRSPSAAKQFQPGQFYRLQNYKTDTNLSMEGLALTGAWVDREKNIISTVILEMGGSSNLCRKLSPGEDVVLMGPSGVPTEITSNEKIMLVGGGLGNAVLFSIGKAFRDKGSDVLYFAGYRNKQSLFMKQNVENAADQVIWCCEDEEITPERDSDIFFKGNVVKAIEKYGSGDFANTKFSLKEIDRVIVIGSDKMMQAVQNMRNSTMKSQLSKSKAIASINSPMQCMMKEICAQCLQRHVDPLTGIESYVYSCANQDQDMNRVDFKHLSDRLKQNSLQEKITSKWIYHLLKE